jgi:hypothetical protein
VDDRRFDALIASVARDGLPRRTALKGVAGAAVGLSLARLGLAGGDVEAKNKRRKKRRKKNTNRCPRGTQRCNINGPNRCCGTECCLFVNEPAGGETFCRSAADVCCTAAQGGGSCGPDFPYCCPPTGDDPEGSCGEIPEDCETSLQAANGDRAPRRAPRGGHR